MAVITYAISNPPTGRNATNKAATDGLEGWPFHNA